MILTDYFNSPSNVSTTQRSQRRPSLLHREGKSWLVKVMPINWGEVLFLPHCPHPPAPFDTAPTQLKGDFGVP